MPDAQIDRLAEALTAEFNNTVQFHPSVPSTVSAPSVIVAPGDPFLEPMALGSGQVIQERWDVLVAVSIKDAASGISQMRELSLRVRKAVLGVGGLWKLASGPRRLTGEVAAASQHVVSINQVTFKYQPDQYTT